MFVNYYAEQKGDATSLFAGVAFVMVAIVLNAVAYRKKGGSGSAVTTKGIAISVLAGVLMSFFYRFIAAAMDLSNFKQPEAGQMTPYTAVVVFSAGVFISILGGHPHQ